MRSWTPVLTVALTLGLLSGNALADAPQPLTRNYEALSDSELDARTAFIMERLDAGKTHAQRWQWGWTGAYASGIVIGTGRAIATSDSANRVDYITTAVKATIGTTRLLVQKHPGRHGAEELKYMKTATRRDKIARLKRAEELFQEVAKKAEERKNWKAHAGNVFLNAAGAGVTWAFGDSDDAYKNLAIGLIVGEAHIWSAPWRGPQDVEDYQVRFGMKSGSRFDWKLVPTVGGAAVQVTW